MTFRPRPTPPALGTPPPPPGGAPGTVAPTYNYPPQRLTILANDRWDGAAWEGLSQTEWTVPGGEWWHLYAQTYDMTNGEPGPGDVRLRWNIGTSEYLFGPQIDRTAYRDGRIIIGPGETLRLYRVGLVPGAGYFVRIDGLRTQGDAPLTSWA